MFSIFKYLIVLLLFSSSLYAKQNILILHSYHQNFKWTQDLTKGLNSVFSKNYKGKEIFIEYMDSKRYVDALHYSNILNTLKYKYKNITFDLIISTDNNAFEFVKKHHESLFQSAPVVFIGVNNLKKEDTLGYKKFTGISQEYDLENNYALIKKLHPNVKNIYTIVDSTVTGKVITEEILRLHKKFNQENIHYEIINNVTLNELVDKIETLPSESAILFTVFYRTKDNKFFDYYEVTNIISGLTDTPIYAVSDIVLNYGVVGGYLTSGFFHGQEAALIGLDILNGKKAEDIPIQYNSPNKYMFDYDKVLLHGIDLELLPKKAILLNKPLSLYEVYKYEIIGLFVLFIFLILFVIILLINIGKRIKIEKQIHRLNAHLEEKVHLRTMELEHTNDELEQTIFSLKNTQESLIKAEKLAGLGDLVSGVANEIDSPVGTSLTGISYLIDVTEDIKMDIKDHKTDDEALLDYLDSTTTIAQSVYSNLKISANLIKSFKQLSSDQLNEHKRLFNVEAYLQGILISLNNTLQKSNVQVDLHCDSSIDIDSYPGSFSQLFTSLIINSIEHGFKDKTSGRITIDIEQHNNNLLITYTDDGDGISAENLPKIFDPFFTTNKQGGSSGLGLNVIYNIVELKFKGSIVCTNEIEKGVAFKITLKV